MTELQAIVHNLHLRLEWLGFRHTRKNVTLFASEISFWLWRPLKMENSDHFTQEKMGQLHQSIIDKDQG